MSDDLKDIIKMGILTIIIFVAYIVWIRYCII